MNLILMLGIRAVETSVSLSKEYPFSNSMCSSKKGWSCFGVCSRSSNEAKSYCSALHEHNYYAGSYSSLV